MLKNYLKIHKSECPDVWIRLPKHEWPKSWEHIEDPVVLLERNFLRTPTRRTLVGKTIRKSIDGTWLGKSTKLRMLFRSQKNKKLFLSVCVDDIKNGRNEAEFSSYVEEIDGRRGHFGGQHHFLITFT